MVAASSSRMNDGDPFLCPSNVDVPSTSEVFAFLKGAYEIAEWSPECNIIALVLVNRFCGTAQYTLSYRNWNKLTLISLLVAQKIWDDVPLTNVDFPQLWGMLFPDAQGFTIKQLNDMERVFLNLIKWQTHVSRSVYCQYYFELRSLAMEGSAAFPLNALTDDQAQRLEMRSQKEHVEGLLTETERKECLKAPATDIIRPRPIPGRLAPASDSVGSRTRKVLS